MLFLSLCVFFSLVHLNLFNNIIMGVRVCWARCYIPMHWGMRANKWPVDHSLLCYNNMYTLCIELLHSTLVVYSLNSYSVWIEWRRMKCKKKRNRLVCAQKSGIHALHTRVIRVRNIATFKAFVWKLKLVLRVFVFVRFELQYPMIAIKLEKNPVWMKWIEKYGMGYEVF